MAVILSFLMPGLGQVYNREVAKGWGIVGATLVLFLVPSVWLVRQAAPMVQTADPVQIQAVMTQIVTANKQLLNIFTFTFLGVWAYSITQAYFKAKEISEKESQDASGS